MNRDTADESEYSFPIISEQTETALNEFGPRAYDDYKQFKLSFLDWLRDSGKNPSRRRGYSMTTVKTTNYKVDKAYRWHWKQSERYTLQFDEEVADDLMEEMALLSNLTDSTLLTYIKAIKRLFKYKNHQENTTHDWDCDVQLTQSSPNNARDYFRRKEFSELYEASLSYNTVKGYHSSSMSPEERDQLKAHLAQRFGTSKDEISPSHFKKANSWKVPSIIAVTLDVGLRPIEVSRAKVGWVNLDHGELNIPKEESTKNFENWNCALSNKAVKAVDRWLDERGTYEKYEGRDELWLTQQGNPYDSNSLNYLLDKLIEETEINERGRDLSWYALRHGVATMWANEEGIHHAQEQLRHKSSKTTMRYVHSDSAMRGSMADSMW